MSNPSLRRIAVKPEKGRTVIDLETNQPIPAEGAEVLDNKYIQRRVLDGDLIQLDSLPKSGKKQAN